MYHTPKRSNIHFMEWRHAKNAKNYLFKFTICKQNKSTQAFN